MRIGYAVRSGMLVGALLVAVKAGADVSVELGPRVSVQPAGSTFDINLRADLTDPVVGFGLDLAFDSGILSLTGPPTIDAGWFAVPAPDGDGLAGAAFPTPISGIDVPLATVTFNADSPGLSPLTLGVTTGDLTEGFPLFPSGFDSVEFEDGWVSVVPDLSVDLLVSFSVDGGRFNPARATSNEAEGLAPLANGVYGFGPNGIDLASEAEIFASPLGGANFNRIPSALGGALGLLPDDNVVALSYGRDGGNVLHFSVDPDAVGFPGSAVFTHATADEAAGDIFVSGELADFGVFLTPSTAVSTVFSNALETDQSEFGLHAPSVGAFGTAEDDVDAVELTSPNEVDGDQDGFVDSGVSTTVFFSLDAFSPTVLAALADPNDILVALDGTGTFSLYADGVLDIMLDEGDEIDAWVHSDVLSLSVLDPGVDEGLFSLTPNSVSVLMGFATPGDIYYTDFNRPFDPTTDYLLGGSLWATTESLGLAIGDNVNAMDVSIVVPEPSTALLVGHGLALLATRRRSPLR